MTHTHDRVVSTYLGREVTVAELLGMSQYQAREFFSAGVWVADLEALVAIVPLAHTYSYTSEDGLSDPIFANAAVGQLFAHLTHRGEECMQCGDVERAQAAEILQELMLA